MISPKLLNQRARQGTASKLLNLYLKATQLFIKYRVEMKLTINLFPVAQLFTLALVVSFALNGCSRSGDSGSLKPKISLVNAPTDILTLGANFMAKEIATKSGGTIAPKVYHSGVLSGGKGEAEIEMCQQGSIEMHITTTAYLANLTPKASVFSLPFLFRDLDQVIALVQSGSPVLKKIDEELNAKNLHILTWWPRGFRQLTNSKRPVRTFQDLQGLKLRVMNNPLYADNMNAMGANPVPMAWGEVYNGLQLKTIDGQENAEDVIFSSKLYEVQQYMTVWDYSTDIEVVLVNREWWKELSEAQRAFIQQAADASVGFQVELLRKNTKDLREKLLEKGMEIYYLPENVKTPFKEAVKPVWDKYEAIFTSAFLDEFLAEVGKY
jgi:tripartite ATP-independent transporter DctP family solute receptor